MEPIPPSAIPPQPVVPPTAPPSPPPPPKKKSFTWLIILVILLLLVSTGVLAYQYYQLKTQTASPAVSPTLTPSPTSTPSQDPTADWKTYIDTENNFSLRYPQNLVSNKSEGKLYLYIESVTPTESETFVPNIAIGNKYKKPENLTNLISWAKSNGETFPNLTKDSEVTLGNNKFTVFESDSGPSAYAIHYLINNNMNIYDFSVRIVGSNEDAGKQLSKYLPQILSTFRFINPSEAPGEGG